MAEILKSGQGLDMESPTIVTESPPVSTSAPSSAKTETSAPAQVQPSNDTPAQPPPTAAKWELLMDEDVIQERIDFRPSSVLPLEKKNFSWDLGKDTYKVVLGHQTAFKKLEDASSENGEKKKNSPFRVIRMENRYRPKNFSFVEFPAKTIPLLIQGLLRAEEIYIQECKIEKAQREELEHEMEEMRRSRQFN